MIKPNKPSSDTNELTTSAKLVEELINLPKNENSSALVTVDLWRVAKLIANKEAEAYEKGYIDGGVQAINKGYADGLTELKGDI